LRLAFALSTFQASGKFEPALRELETKPKADQTFVNFRGFVQKEFGQHNKQNKTTAKSVRHGIANSITDKEVKQIKQLEAHALFRCRVGKQHARAKPEAIQRNDGAIQSKA
jgi:hypothetical protein